MKIVWCGEIGRGGKWYSRMIVPPSRARRSGRFTSHINLKFVWAILRVGGSKSRLGPERFSPSLIMCVCSFVCMGSEDADTETVETCCHL